MTTHKLVKTKTVPFFENHERFLSKITVIGECWIFPNASVHGYGCFGINHVSYRAHRVSYSIFNGQLTPGMVVDHMCKNKKCVNPEHLRLVFQVENMEMNFNLLVMCGKGQEFTPENSLKIKNGRRCRRCHNDQKKLARNRKKGCL